MPGARDPRTYFEQSYIPEPNSGCWVWMRTLCDGYGALSVGKKYRSPSVKYHMLRAHRVAWELYRSPIPDGMHVLHRCDVRCCVNPDHLFLGTEADNSADKIAKGRDRHTPCPGVLNAMAKLNEAKVGEIRRRRALGENWKVLEKEFGVSHKTIWKIGKGYSWRHV